MKVIKLPIAPAMLIKPVRHPDSRGYFSELYQEDRFSKAGLDFDFVQDNVSVSSKRGTIRGLHFQSPPSQQTKLVSVLHGAVYDVVVDIRVGSPTYGKHVAAELSAENGLQMLVPCGFAHGLCTIAPDTVVAYKVDRYYDGTRDFGLRWDDPALRIAWPVEADETHVFGKDLTHPMLADLPAYFTYDGSP